MLTRLYVKNFRIIDEAELELRPLTVLMGPNAVGKSSLIYAIVALYELLLGSQTRIIQDFRQGTDAAAIGLEVDNKFYMLLEFDRLTGEVQITRLDLVYRSRPILSVRNDEYFRRELPRLIGRRAAESSRVFVRITENELVVRVRYPGESGEVIEDTLLHITREGVVTPTDTTRLVEVCKVLVQDVTLCEYINSLGGEEGRELLARTVFYVIDNIVATLRRAYLCPSGPRRYILDDHCVLSRRLEPRPLEPAEDGLLPGLIGWSRLEKSGFEDRIVELARRLGFELDIDVDEGPSVRVRHVLYDVGIRVSASLDHTASGHNQLLKLLTLIAASRPGDVLIVEDPEIHLHPQTQAKLMDILIEQVNSGKQVILTTHSVHMLVRLLRRVREQVISADKVAIYYLTRRGERVFVERIYLSQSGRLLNPEVLQDFFGEDVEYLEALVRQVREREIL